MTSRPLTAQATTLPAPVLGWNGRDNIDAMDPSYATALINFIPKNVVALRRGSARYTASALGGAVESLIPHSDTNGTEKLFAAANTTLFDVSTATPSSLSTAPTNDRWQYTQLDGATVMVNGVDTPFYYTVAAGLTGTTWTGTSFTAANMIDVASWKGRLYCVEKDTATIWYGGDGAFATVTFTAFPVGKLLSRGGPLAWVGAYSRDTGSQSDDLLVAMSKAGEILVYAGAYPGAADFSLVARFFVAPPLGVRSKFNLGSDLILITQNGTFPLSALLSIGESNQYQALSDAISRPMNEAGRLYASNFGWCGAVYEKGQYALVNVPVSATRSEQYIFNPQTRAWAQFQGQNALCWAIYKGSPYFGHADGYVHLADSGGTDNGERVAAKCHWAYNYLGDRARRKKVLQLSPFLTTDASINFNIGVDYDYRNLPLFSRASVNLGGTPWNTAPWNTFQWSSGYPQYLSRTFGAGGIGNAVQVRFEGSFAGATCELSVVGLLFNYAGLK